MGAVGDVGRQVLCETCCAPCRLGCVLLLKQEEDVLSAGLHLCTPLQGFSLLLRLLELCRHLWLRVMLPSRLLLDGGLLEERFLLFYLCEALCVC